MERLYYYLSRGLWSFGCHFQHEKPTEQKKEEEKLLWCIAADPTKFSFCSELIDTPWGVSWLAASTIQSRKKTGCDGNIVSLHEVEAVKKEAEFQQLLTSLPNASTSAVIFEELMYLYGQVVRAEHISTPVNHITATARQFLKDCLLKDPITTNEVIQLLLCVWSPYFEEPDEDLQNIYLEILEAGVETLERIGGQNADLAHYQSALLCIVSQFEVSEQRMEAIRYLLIRLCEAGVLPRDMLYLALISRAKPKLLTSLGVLEDEKYERTSVLFDSENIQRISGRLLNADSTLNTEELFLRAVKTKRHWIEDLLELCGQLLIDNQSETVVRYFSCGMMNKLWPLLLLHIWKHFSDHSDICEMLQFLLQYCKEAVTDPLLSLGCMIVEKQIVVALWCRKHALPLSCKDLLDMTATHSLLEVLFRTTKLSQLPLEEVRELLIKNVPDFQDSEVTDSENCSSISWEVSTFDGFCVLRKVLTIIQASIEIDKLSKTLNRSKSDVPKMQSIPMYFTHNWLSVILQCSVGEDKVTDSMDLESLYKENVTQQLEELKKMLSRLFPLKFRIDILEDIFSLLFLRCEDLTEESSSESGEEDYVEQDTRNCTPVNITGLLMRRMSHESSDCNAPSDVSLQTIPVIEAQVSGVAPFPASPPKLLATSSPAAVRHAPVKITETQTSSSLPASFTAKSAGVTHIRRDSKKSLSARNISEVAATMRGQNHGFLLDKTLVRDLLYMLKESLVDLSAAHYSLLASQLPVLGRQDDVQLRIKLLLQYVSEAAWRLQLIAGTEFMQRSGYDPQAVDCNIDTSSDWLYQSDESASEDEEETNIRVHKTSLRKCKSETERSSESGSQSANTEMQKVRRKSHIGKAPLPVINRGVINLMLAPHSSMVIRCLMHGELSKAKQIIQMLDMKGENHLPKEVMFMESYCSLKVRLNETLKESKSPYQPKVLSLNAPEIGIQVTTLQDIKKVASAGMHSTSLTSMVQSFLSVTEIPEVRGSREIGKEFVHESTLLHESENSAAMVCLDLALTVGSTSEHSASLLDVAYKHSTTLQSMGPPDSCSKTKPVGYIQFARTAVYVLKEAKRTETSLLPKNMCLRGIVNSENLPFSMKGIRDYITFWNTLSVATMELQQELNNVTPRNYTYLTEFHSIKPHEIFRRIISLCKGWQLNTQGSKQHLNYLQQIHEYLKHVSYLALYNWQGDSGVISELMKPNSLFDLLKEDLTSLIGKLVFEQDVSPTQLEPVTNKLKLDIVHNIVCNCCPKIPSFYAFQEGAKGIRKKWGKIVLNDSQYTGTSSHPEVAVRSLLSDVLQTIQEELGEEETYSFQLKQGINLWQSDQLQRVFAKTNELSAIDITWLSVGDETLAFFVNLTNLLWIHSLLALETGAKPYGLLSHCAFERQVAQKSVGYLVGQLGFISLLQLQKNLLGDMAFSPATSVLKHFASVENLRCEKWKESIGSTVDPRVLFVLTNGQMYSPKVQVIHVENMDKQLDTSLSDYLNENVRLEDGNDAAQQLVVPELLLVYQDLVLLNQEPESHSTLPGLPAAQSPHHFSLMVNTEQLYSRERLSQLLDFLRESFNYSTLQKQIADFASSVSEVLVKVERNSGKFGITLCYGGTKEHTEDKDAVDEVEDIWKQRVVHESVLKFLEHHCWLLSLLVQQIHKEKSLHASPVTEGPSRHQALDERVQVLMNIFQSDWVATIAPIFDSNAAVAGLHLYPSSTQLWNFLECLARKRDWQHCVEVLWTLPEKELQENSKLQALNDVAMFELASKLPAEGDPSPWWYCQHIGDVSVQVHCMLQQLPQWPGSACAEALQAVLGDSSKHLSAADKLDLENMLHNISIYSKVLEVLNSADIKTWYDVCCTSQNNPRLILDYLIQAKDSQLCLQWAELHKIPMEAKYLIDYKFIQLLLESESVNFIVAQELLESLPTPQVVHICDKLICVLRSLPCLKFLTDLLLNSYWAHLSAEQMEQYKNLSIGIKMVSSLPAEEQSQLWELIGQPIWLIEQYLMNTRLEMLERMLLEVQPLLSELPSASPLSVNNIDKLLRQYAAKALDFRVAHAPFRTFPSQERLMASLSLASNHSEEFVMPAIVPTKNEWVPNDQVSACMCCEAVSFSMFNRRHHCRRCGRVICWACSKNRMKVAGYGEMPVRVCNDCHLHSKGDIDLPSPSTDESKPPFSLDMGGTDFTWRLSSDEMYNAMVREDFAYDYAPSVSLCLSILKLHSEHVAHPRFLLDACDRMLQLLQPIDGSVNPEVDYSLVIRMVRCLVVAAKVKHAQAGYNTGVAHCDELLSQVDLLNLLVKSGCSSLLPAESLGGLALRRLRDRLVSEELWALAMDVSTKSGLDKAGMWAAWGKACLRAGCWSAAREKFSHCLDASTRPARNPPLLVEILQILEEGAYAVDHKILQHADKLPTSSQALAVIHTLSSLKDIAQGNYLTLSTNTVIIGPKMDSLFYLESCYYIQTYGSHMGILGFYLKHDDMSAALKHALENKIDPDIFLEAIYIPCLQHGIITDLHGHLTVMDPTLHKWKVYLCHVCHKLEKQGLLNVLYQLQLFMQDYIRAAMTCIRFYRVEARCYSDLATNLEHLYIAQKHLETELSFHSWQFPNQSSPAQPERDNTVLAMKLEPREINRHISTILRQIEVTRFLEYCEKENRQVLRLLRHLQVDSGSRPLIPTLFDANTERMHLAALIILCGRDVEEGFGLAYRIMEDYQLRTTSVFNMAGRVMARQNHTADIAQLVRCIQSSGIPDSNSLSDSMLTLCIQIFVEGENTADVEPIIKLISDSGTKILAYIKCQQLKSAYLLAVKHNRLEDVQRILEAARKLGQTKIEQICLKRLAQQSGT